MTKHKKSRAPQIDLIALRALKGGQAQPAFLGLSKRFEQFEALRRAGKLPTTFIAFEAISAFMAGRVEGYAQQELEECWPVEWGTQKIELPAALVGALASAWGEYRDHVGTKALGTVFQLEGKSNKSRKTVTNAILLDRDRRLAQAVELAYLVGAHEKVPTTIEEAQERVAQETNNSNDTVKKAHRKYRSEVRAGLKELGIL
jgi:hypothetical protein